MKFFLFAFLFLVPADCFAKVLCGQVGSLTDRENNCDIQMTVGQIEYSLVMRGTDTAYGRLEFWRNNSDSRIWAITPVTGRLKNEQLCQRIALVTRFRLVKPALTSLPRAATVIHEERFQPSAVAHEYICEVLKQ
jgi:hypothetical protein